jgi:hypothetical protein
MEQHTISSSGTFAMKVLLPLLATIIFVSAILCFSLQLILLSLVCLGLYLLSAASLKRVSIDTTNMYVSNYMSECVVPLGAIDGVFESQGSTRIVTVHFRDQTPFGDQITFVPKMPTFGMWSGPHPIVAQLQQLASLHAAQPSRSTGPLAAG